MEFGRVLFRSGKRQPPPISGGEASDSHDRRARALCRCVHFRGDRERRTSAKNSVTSCLREGHRPARHRQVPTPISLNRRRSEEHTSELQSLMRISYAVFCLKKKTKITNETQHQ